MSAEIALSQPGLIETLGFSRRAGFARLDLHLARLAASSAALGHAHFPEKARAALAEAVRQTEGEHLRVRLQQEPDGSLRVTAQAFSPFDAQTQWRAVITDHRLDPDDALLAHKTTRRDFYDAARARSGADEAIFLNSRDELCEGGITSIFVPRDGLLLTPALSCGLLAGVLRAELLASGKAREAVLGVEDLRAGFFLGNSLRGLIRARLG